MRLLLSALYALTLLYANAASAQARPPRDGGNLPFCYRTPERSLNCVFVTISECELFAQNRSGRCVPNPHRSTTGAAPGTAPPPVPYNKKMREIN